MLHIRKAMNIMDSYTDETGLPVASELEKNIDLDFDGFEEENAQLTKQYELTRGSLIALIKLYTAGSEINGKLIQAGGDPDALDMRYRREYDALKSLDNMVQLAEEHHVYSGTGTFDPSDVTTDGVFRTPAFMSMSISLKVAVKTTNYRRQDDEDHVIHTILPKGFTNGFYVAPYSHDPEELEFLIMPNVEFDFVSTRKLDLGGVTRHIHSYRARR